MFKKHTRQNKWGHAYKIKVVCFQCYQFIEYVLVILFMSVGFSFHLEGEMCHGR
jgi:hypothetical protein